MSAFKLAEKFGYVSPFQSQSQEEGIYDGVINYQELADYLNSCGRFLYNYKDFISKEEVTFDTSPRSVISIDLFNVDVDVPLIVRENGRDHKVQISGELNKKEGSVSVRQGKVFFNFKINKDKEIEYTKKIRYEFSNETAIKLTTNNYYDHVALSSYIRTKDNEAVKELITGKFKKVFTHADNDIGLLKWLYQQAPQFVLQKRGDSQLITDLFKLVAYDKDSWFKDASSAILNLLTGFNDISKLYDYFIDNPDKVIETYSILDTNSQEQFAKLLDAVSIPLTKDVDRITDAKFFVGKGYILDSNIFLEDNQKIVNLQHFELRATIMDEFLEDIGLEELQFQFAVNKKTQFHPLDLVTMIDVVTGEEKIVTAMHVKTLSDKKEWEDVVSTTVIVVSIIAILVSAGTLSAGATGFVAVIATTELVVGSLDLLKELLKRSDKEYSGAIKWFVDNWDYLSGTHGVISITSAIRSGILKHGPKLLARIRNLPNSQRVVRLTVFIEELVYTIRLEFYFASRLGLAYCEFLPFINVARLLGKGGQKIAEKMQKFGLLMAEPIAGSPDVRALIYFGVKIAEGKIGDLKKILGRIFPHAAKKEDVLKYLNDLYEIGKLARSGSGGFLKYTKVTSRNMFKQEEWMSCAAACLRKYADDLGIKITESEIRILAKTSETGTDGQDLYYAMVKIFNDKEVFAKTYFESLDELKNFDAMLLDSGGKGFITNVGFPPNKHTIIVDKIVGKKVHIKDPWPLEVDDAFEQGIRGKQLEEVFNSSISGVEAIIDLDHFKNLWIEGGNIMFKIK